MIVAKFGGSSLADAKQFQKVRAIVTSHERRRVVVPSAPGKRFSDDDKITDMLYYCFYARQRGDDFDAMFQKISERYWEIAQELSLSVNLQPYLEEIHAQIVAGANADYCASRGEYLNGILLANYLGFRFLDAAEVIFFDKNGVLDSEKTNRRLAKRLAAELPVVLPGFYGSDAHGNIRVFSRGGSDITGALAARACEAEVYENWTDVSGFLMADPRIVSNPLPIRHVTYHEMHALASAGATVLHEDSVAPVSQDGIPTQIRNTNDPTHPGTLITSTAVRRENFSIFAGIAGKKGYSLLLAEKQHRDASPAFMQGVFQAAQHCGMDFQLLSVNGSHLCLLIETEQYETKSIGFWEEISEMGVPYFHSVEPGFACIVLVGYGVVHNYQTINRIYKALQKREIEVSMITQGMSEISTWVAVQEDDMEDAIRTLYEEFCRDTH
ncbi:MAG TPA: aspartate kinase [Candidatus Ruthenibacterium avium]|uniref:Aspartokinase n=1 Tax=Candidatus Ruthenibacterium avium TaxID=2838751 RepID=A0A9D2M2K4_9FIRM|nr:aspartate kinase [Candidatus Ruthenibacterium avium]